MVVFQHAEWQISIVESFIVDDTLFFFTVKNIKTG